MSQAIRWGILGTGFVAGEFAKGLLTLKDARLLGIASRTKANAQAFANVFKVERVYDSYEQLVKDPDIDVVYIATPQETHKNLSILCLQAGKPILCEKPFALNAQEASEIINLARQKQLFCMEAMWMRFMPLIQEVKAIIDRGDIGEVKMMMADFGNPVEYNPNSRFFNPQLGGGALLDRGVYCLSLAYYLLGAPERIVSSAAICETGADEQSSVILNYPQGKLAVLSQSLRTYSSNEAVIMGTKGKIRIHELFIKPDRISVTKFSVLTQSYSSSLQAPSFKQKLVSAAKQNSLIKRVYITLSGLLKSERTIVKPVEANGYNYEAAEVINCLRNKQLESKIMPLDDTLKIMETMDNIRSQWQ
ncbi:MAG: Gfo/Idh/MocA family protein [Xenococcaceae cyanobacterium]